MKYRKKPVVIEAFQLERRELNWPQWAHDALTENVIISHNTGKWHNPSEETYLIIKTLEGDHKACLGDYIIRGVKGEIYPCKPDIFELTYESVSDGIGEIYDTKKIPTAHGSTMHGMGFR